MKKSFNPVSDVRGESVEVSRRLYRVISDAIRHLDDSRGRAETCNDLFTLPLEAQRERLREYCERLIFADPIGYGRKGEELLWRKVYYDVVTTAKHLRKDQSWGDTEVAHLKSHLFAGVGHYHHLIDRLQIEYQLDLKGLVDFPLPLKGKRSSSKRSPDKTCVEWSKQAVHRCLVYLGDLSRYILDLHPHWDYGLAVRYYLQALNMNWEVGMPHNQLGTLAGLRNYGLDASYHYMRCLLCPQSFEGAEGNLVRLFEKNSCWLEGEGGNSRNMGLPSPTSSENIHRLISRFLLLQDVWFFDKTAVPDLPQLCHQTLQDLQHCLSYLKPFTEPKEYQLESEEHPSVPDCPDYLCDNTVLRMVVMVLMCVTKLQNADSQQLSSAVAFLAAMFSQLVDQVIQHFQDSVLSLSLPPAPLPLSTTTSLTSDVSNTGQGITQEKDDKKNKKRKKKLRRRRRRRLNSSEDSDLSEGEGPFGESSSSEDAEDFNSDISEKGEREGDTSSGDDAEDDSEDESSLNSAANDKGLIGGEMKEKICNGKCKEKDQLICEAVTNGFSVESNSSGSPLSVVNEGCDVIPKTEEPLVNGTNNPAPNRLLDPADVVELLGEEGLLAAVKVCADWMRGDSEVVKACGRSSRLLLSHVVTLLNLINVDIEALEKETDAPHFVRMKMLNTSMQSIPLPEDIGLKGISPLKTSHNGLDWDYFRDNSFKVKEEGLLRAFKLVEFGHYLASIPDTGMRYDSSTRQFVISEEPPTLSPEVPEIEEKGKRTSKPANPDADAAGQRRGQLMHHMGQLWLRAEVRDLESRVRRRGAAFSPYLAVDGDALIYHIHLVKQLVGARKFIVLIPSVVVSALDKLKREVSRAREAIRWLESQFQRGNRFLRAQRNHEQLPLPLIKYPKKKDREAWLFFQVLECCHYFSQQTGVHEIQPDISVVTLLTGHKDEHNKMDFSPVGVAKSAGIHLEFIESFHSKWKASSKSHG